MSSDKSSTSPTQRAADRTGVLVGKPVSVRHKHQQPDYFTDVHRKWIGKTGRVHAVVASVPRDNPLVKVGFDEGTQIVFFRLSELDVHAEGRSEPPRKHGKRGSHLPE
jgi:hypothetical protein